MMKEIIQILYDNEERELCFYNPKTISFHFPYFSIALAFAKNNLKELANEENNDSEEDGNADQGYGTISSQQDLDDIIALVDNHVLTEFYISITEYLGYREDVVTYVKETDKYYVREQPISIANCTFGVIKQLNLLDKRIVKKQHFFLDDPSEGYCDGDPNFVSKIHCDIDIMGLDTVTRILTLMIKFVPVKIPISYCTTFLREKPKNIFKPQFVNTNTKVRRLGYLKAFSNFIGVRKRVPEVFVSNKFEQYALPFTIDLLDSVNKKGIIQESNGKSAEPYVMLLKQFDLITTINKVVVPTKWLKTYIALMNEDNQQGTNIFNLTPLDKMFFLEVILKKDYLYFSVMLEFLNLIPCTVQELTDNFQSLLLGKLENLIWNTEYIDTKAAIEIKLMVKRISSWTKPKKYLEHIIMPRINWMADLELVNIEGTLITVTENGERLFRELCFWTDMATELVADSSDFLKMHYPHIYSRTYHDSNGIYPNKDVIIETVSDNIEESFQIFETLAPNRVTISQAITFSKYKILLRNGYCTSERFHIRMLETKLSHLFIYKYQQSYEDGYIQKIKP